MMYLPASRTRITRSWETRGMVLPPESPEGTSPAHTDISDVLTPGLWATRFLLCRPPSLWCFAMAAPGTHVTVCSGPEDPPGALHGRAHKAHEATALAPPAFAPVYFPFFALQSLYILPPHPCSPHLRVQKCGFQSKGHLGNNYTGGLQVEIPDLHGKLGKGILSPRNAVPFLLSGAPTLYNYAQMRAARSRCRCF